MKKLQFIVLGSIILFSSCTSMKEAQKSDFGNTEKIIESSLAKNEIYSKIIAFISDSFITSKVLDYTDKELGIINIKAHHVFNQAVYGVLQQEYWINYKLEIRIKDNKYKLTIIPLDAIYTYNMQQSHITDTMAKSFSDNFISLCNRLEKYVNTDQKEIF